MIASADLLLLKRSFLLTIGLVLVLLFPGEPAHAAPLQATSISLYMSNPACVQALPASGSCAIQIGSLTAIGSDTTFSRVEVLVNGKLRFYMGGFFESTANFSYQMIPGGLKVPCGRPNAGGLPNYGQPYSVAANAYMADGTSTNGAMTVYCPAYDGKTYLPSIRR